MKVKKVEFFPDSNGLYIYVEHNGTNRVFSTQDLVRIWGDKEDDEE